MGHALKKEVAAKVEVESSKKEVEALKDNIQRQNPLKRKLGPLFGLV